MMIGSIYYRSDADDWEWVCEHGIGHYIFGGVHGCDGCCSRLTPIQKKEIITAIKRESKPWMRCRF